MKSKTINTFEMYPMKGEVGRFSRDGALVGVQMLITTQSLSMKLFKLSLIS
jgi:hypothetical protein